MRGEKQVFHQLLGQRRGAPHRATVLLRPRRASSYQSIPQWVKNRASSEATTACARWSAIWAKGT